MMIPKNHLAQVLNLLISWVWFGSTKPQFIRRVTFIKVSTAAAQTSPKFFAPLGLKSKKKFNLPTCRCPWAGRLSVGCCDKESLSDMLWFPELYRCDSLRGPLGHFWHLQRKTATQFGITYYNSFSQVNHTSHLRQKTGFCSGNKMLCGSKPLIFFRNTKVHQLKHLKQTFLILRGPILTTVLPF